MALSPGVRLGPYEVVGSLGAGGMGEVYRARDTRLGREVALKVLPARVAGDRASRERFEREAKSISALNHPNICTLYDVGRHEDIDFLVMEFVEGEDLSTVIRRDQRAAGAEAPALHQRPAPALHQRPAPALHQRPAPALHREGRPGADSKWSPGASAPGIPVDEALALARQIALALEAAHERGIVHRDLKPGNIKITPDGTVKVLDFGLAKAFGFPGAEAPGLHPDGAGLHPDDAANSPTFTAFAPTQAGVILGTAAYMSPEQARGRPVDKRTDIWAFGCVLYEILTGRPAFDGETVTDVLSAIVSKTPDWTALPPAAPPAVRRVLRRCLEKDVRVRLRDIGDARLEIDHADSLDVPVAGAAGPAARGPRRRLTWVAAAGAVVALALVAWLVLRPPPPEPPWTGVRLATPSVAFMPRISPRGDWVAYQAMEDRQTQVAVMKPETGESMILTSDRSRGVITDISWSPDGNRLYFGRFYDAPRGVFSVTFPGRVEQPVLDSASRVEVLPDGSLLVDIPGERGYQLHRFWPESNQLQPFDVIVQIPFFNLMLGARSTPSGSRAVVFGRPLDRPDARPGLHLLDLASGHLTPLAPSLPLHEAWVPLAVADERSVVTTIQAEDVHQIVTVPLDGSNTWRPLAALSTPIMALDVGRDGSIYLDQFDRAAEVLRFPPKQNSPQFVGALPMSLSGYTVLPLPDGSVLANSSFGGRRRLVVFATGGGSTPFLGEVREETTLPVALVGQGQVAFTLGTGRSRVIAIASLADRRVVRRLEETQGLEVSSLAASPDGQTLFFVADRAIWSMPVTGGKPERLREGVSVSVDPTRGDLIVLVSDREGTRLVRSPIGGGTDRAIPVKGQFRVAPDSLSLRSNAVGRDGRIVAIVTSPDDWFWPVGVIDPVTGRVERVHAGYDADMGGGWAPDGSLVAYAISLRSTLWRFRLVHGR